jgi:hypothetical protein
MDGLTKLFEKTGFEVLDFFTPGTLDVEYVLQARDAAAQPDDLFLRRLLDEADTATLLDLQRFLQKNGLSSSARIVARKVG